MNKKNINAIKDKLNDLQKEHQELLVRNINYFRKKAVLGKPVVGRM